MSHPHYKLHYFDLGGRGEFIRQLFAYAQVPFEDYRIKFPDDWPAHKPNYPNGQVPALEVDGQMLTQSYAIGRYLAHKFGLGGKDDWESAKADSYIDGVEDTLRDTVPLIRAALLGDGNKEEQIEIIRPKVLEPFLKRYEKFLTDNGGVYYVGNALTWADIVIADFIDRYRLFIPTLIDDHPLLKQFVDRIQHLPNIKQHIDHRPKFPF